MSVTVPPGTRLRPHPRRRVTRAALAAGDIAPAGVPVTSRLRTAFDLGRQPDRRDAVVALDATGHRHLVTVAALESYRRPGVPLPPDRPGRLRLSTAAGRRRARGRSPPEPRDVPPGCRPVQRAARGRPAGAARHRRRRAPPTGRRARQVTTATRTRGPGTMSARPPCATPEVPRPEPPRHRGNAEPCPPPPARVWCAPKRGGWCRSWTCRWSGGGEAGGAGSSRSAGPGLRRRLQVPELGALRRPQDPAPAGRPAVTTGNGGGEALPGALPGIDSR